MVSITKFLLKKLGYIHISDLRKQLNYGPSIDKRLDEHREVVDDIQARTDFLKTSHGALRTWRLPMTISCGCTTLQMDIGP